MKTKPCTTCGSLAHAYCSTIGGGLYVLGHPKFFGAVIGKCPTCNSLIGSAIGGCDNPYCTAKDTRWVRPSTFWPRFKNWFKTVFGMYPGEGL